MSVEKVRTPEEERPIIEGIISNLIGQDASGNYQPLRKESILSEIIEGGRETVLCSNGNISTRWQALYEIGLGYLVDLVRYHNGNSPKSVQTRIESELEKIIRIEAISNGCSTTYIHYIRGIDGDRKECKTVVRPIAKF